MGNPNNNPDLNSRLNPDLILPPRISIHEISATLKISVLDFNLFQNNSWKKDKTADFLFSPVWWGDENKNNSGNDQNSEFPTNSQKCVKNGGTPLKYWIGTGITQFTHYLRDAEKLLLTIWKTPKSASNNNFYFAILTDLISIITRDFSPFVKTLDVFNQQDEIIGNLKIKFHFKPVNNVSFTGNREEPEENKIWERENPLKPISWSLTSDKLRYLTTINSLTFKIDKVVFNYDVQSDIINVNKDKPKFVLRNRVQNSNISYFVSYNLPGEEKTSTFCSSRKNKSKG